MSEGKWGEVSREFCSAILFFGLMCVLLLSTSDVLAVEQQASQSRMVCECPSMLKGLQGWPLALAGLLGFLLIASAISALFAMTIFFIRRSRIRT